MRSTALFGAFLATVLTTSCSEPGQTRHRISGEAFFDGQPIPYGDVLFTPEGSGGGAQGIATIKNGKFDTSNSDGKGIAGGPTTVRVTGLSAEGGKLLCEYEYRVDLPKDSSTLKIEVPASAAPKAGGSGKKDI